MDRLARSLRQLIETVEALGERGIGFQSVTDSPSGRLFFHIVGAMAEFERGVPKERVRAGLEHARSQGRLGGRPRKMTALGVAKARAMLQAAPQATVESVAATLGVSPSTLYPSLPGGRQALGL